MHGDDVELDLRLQAGAVHGVEAAGVAGAGVVDQVVDDEPLGGEAGDESAALAGVGEVAGPGVDVEAGVRRDELLLQRDEAFAAAGDEDERAAVAGGQARELAADAGAGAGDEGDGLACLHATRTGRDLTRR